MKKHFGGAPQKRKTRGPWTALLFIPFFFAMAYSLPNSFKFNDHRFWVFSVSLLAVIIISIIRWSKSRNKHHADCVSPEVCTCNFSGQYEHPET